MLHVIVSTGCLAGEAETEAQQHEELLTPDRSPIPFEIPLEIKGLQSTRPPTSIYKSICIHKNIVLDSIDIQEDLYIYTKC